MGGGIGTNRLSDRRVKSFAARKDSSAKKKLFDGGGLFITHTPKGTPVWRLKYRIGGKDRLYAIGAYPEITLETARAARESARVLIREGIDPVQARQVRRADAVTSSENTFQTVAEAWLAKNARFWSEIHAQKSREAFERDVFPVIGRLPIAQITPSIVAKVIEKILERDVRETATKILQHIVGVFRLAQALGLRTDNPASPARELIPKKRIVQPRPALLAIEPLRDVLRRADLAPISPAVRLAQRLCAFSACRLGNVVAAEWREFQLDIDIPAWTIPREKMKARDAQNDHTVILGPTIAAELREWRQKTGGKGYVFPSAKPGGVYEHITREAVEKAYRVTLKLANTHSLHGWRVSMSTIARDAGFSRDVVELALDHVHDTAVVRAYDRGERLEERVRLMLWWDALLNPPPAEVIPIATARTVVSA